MRIAFIGTGVMGASMAGHLLRAGHSIQVYNRSREKARGLLEAGAGWRDSAGEAAEEAEAVITMLGYPSDVEESYLGPGGIVERTTKGALLIDMTTSSPALARRIADAAAARGLSWLDAPVSGGDIGARQASLVIMTGGEPEAFARGQPILALMGKLVLLHGPAGSGQHCKMANQIAVAVGMVAWCESLSYACRAGLDPARVQQTLSAGAAGSWAMAQLAPRALAGDFAAGFYVKHIRKDLRIALESAAELKLPLPGLELAARLYDQLGEQGGQELGTQALLRLYTQM